MTIDELVKDIQKKEDDKLARAFTLVIGSLLLSKGIQPIINKSSEVWNANDDLSKYIIRKEYKATFDLDTTEHDAKVRADGIEEFAEHLINPSNYERYDFDDCLTDSGKANDFFKYVFAIAEQLKEQKNDTI